MFCGLWSSVDDSKSVVLCVGRCPRTPHDKYQAIRPAHQVVPLPCNRMQYQCVLLLWSRVCSFLLLRGIDFSSPTTALTPSSQTQQNFDTHSLIRQHLIMFPLSSAEFRPSVPSPVTLAKKKYQNREDRCLCSISIFYILWTIDRSIVRSPPPAQPGHQQGEEGVGILRLRERPPQHQGH
jgi:hypothetical protein